ncbi:MAG: BamA/TamA family outer membrane protein [bacterium]|nr:BamA/TamA family outer membrane protein [bacterium]
MRVKRIDLAGIIFLGLLTLTLAMAFPVLSKETTHERPSIGLVLGGGGARGAAHVGVLRALEEMNIPVDYVTGTSMGSVVGALFAIGLTPDEIEEILMGVDWDDLFSDRPARQERNFRRKQDDSASFLPVEWGWKGRIVLSSGMIAGQKLSFAFRNNYLYLAGHNGFDNLPYPFRAVATDLQTGQMFIPDKGNLLKIVRASMSIPGVFPPVEWEGHTLVDGYLARNLPVDVCREMGADIIIAVDVGSLPEETDPYLFETIGGVNMQKGIINSRQNVDPQLEFADVIIQPILNISSRDFVKVGLTIEPGYEAAYREEKRLRELAVSHEQYQQHLKLHQHPGDVNLVIDEIRLNNHSGVHNEAILKSIRQQAGQVLNLDELKSDLAEIYDFGVFDIVDFSLEEDDNEITLVISAEEKFYSPNILNFGFSYYGGAGNVSDLDARVRWNRLEMNRFGAELRTDAQAGKSTFLRSEFYQPLTWKRIPFVSLSGKYKSQILPWYYELFHYGNYKIQAWNFIPDVGARIGHWGEVRAGVEFGHLKGSGRTGVSGIGFDGYRGGYRFMVKFDKEDYPFLPRSGYEGYLRYFAGRPEFGSDLNYDKFEGRISLASTFAGNTFHFSLQGGTNFGSSLPEFDMFTLGGMNRLMGYQRDQLRGQRYSLGQVKWYHKLAGEPSPFSTSWYVALMVEAGNAWYAPEDAAIDDLRYTGSIAFVGTTPMGPLSIAYGRADDGNDSLYVTLGFLKQIRE